MGHPVDVHVGGRVRYRRWMLGMSQQALAAELGVTFQQVQKYEIGANRISASRLWSIARLLGVPVEFFFEGLLPGEAPDPASGGGTGRAAADGLVGERSGVGPEAAGGDAQGSACDTADPVGDPVGDALAIRGARPVRGGVSPPAGVASLVLDRDAATLLRSFIAIPAPKRRRLLDLARALSVPQDGTGAE